MNKNDKMDGLKNSKNLLDVQNYNKSITVKIYYDSINIYIGLGIQCVKYLLDNLKTKNKEYLNFIINRGLTTLEHVHNIIFMYTKSSDLLEHHLEKAYLYYVEFVSQIGEETNSYIKLNSKDATLFVYKKTIYDINQEYRNNMKLTKNNKKYIERMRSFTEVYNNVILNIIELISCDMMKTEDKLKEYMKYNNEFEKVISIIYNIYIEGDYKNYSKIMKDLSYDLINNNTPISKYLKILNLVGNKYFKNELSYEDFQKKMYNINKEKIYNMTSLKYVNWLFSRQ